MCLASPVREGLREHALASCLYSYYIIYGDVRFVFASSSLRPGMHALPSLPHGTYIFLPCVANFGQATGTAGQ